MTIVIPYKTEVHAGTELKFALRSIEKYLTGWDNIVIVGDCPDWILKSEVIKSGQSKKVIFGIHHIPATDQTARKEFNIYSKLLKVCGLDDLPENFIYWNDDHFLLRPIHVSEIKSWYCGTLQQDLNRPSSARYRSDIQQTIMLLNNVFGARDFKNFDIHVPIIFNKHTFKMIFKDLTSELCIKSYYCEMSGVKGEEMPDCKIDGWHEKEKVKQIIDNKLFFSNGTSLCRPTLEVLEDLLPRKSKFEL